MHEPRQQHAQAADAAVATMAAAEGSDVVDDERVVAAEHTMSAPDTSGNDDAGRATATDANTAAAVVPTSSTSAVGGAPAADEDVTSVLRYYRGLVERHLLTPPRPWRHVRFDLPSTVAELQLYPPAPEVVQYDEPVQPSPCLVLLLEGCVPANMTRSAYCAQLVGYLVELLRYIRATSAITTLRFVKKGAELSQLVFTLGTDVQLATAVLVQLQAAGIAAGYGQPLYEYAPNATFEIIDYHHTARGGAGISADDVRTLLTPFRQPRNPLSTATAPQHAATTATTVRSHTSVVPTADIHVIEGYERGVFYAAVKRPETVFSFLFNPRCSFVLQSELFARYGVLVTMAPCPHEFLAKGVPYHIQKRQKELARMQALQRQRALFSGHVAGGDGGDAATAADTDGVYTFVRDTNDHDEDSDEDSDEDDDNDDDGDSSGGVVHKLLRYNNINNNNAADDDDDVIRSDDDMAVGAPRASGATRDLEWTRAAVDEIDIFDVAAAATTNAAPQTAATAATTAAAASSALRDGGRLTFVDEAAEADVQAMLSRTHTSDNTTTAATTTTAVAAGGGGVTTMRGQAHILQPPPYIPAAAAVVSVGGAYADASGVYGYDSNNSNGDGVVTAQQQQPPQRQHAGSMLPPPYMAVAQPTLPLPPAFVAAPDADDDTAATAAALYDTPDVPYDGSIVPATADGEYDDVYAYNNNGSDAGDSGVVAFMPPPMPLPLSSSAATAMYSGNAIFAAPPRQQPYAVYHDGGSGGIGVDASALEPVPYNMPYAPSGAVLPPPLPPQQPQQTRATAPFVFAHAHRTDGHYTASTTAAAAHAPVTYPVLVDEDDGGGGGGTEARHASSAHAVLPLPSADGGALYGDHGSASDTGNANAGGGVLGLRWDVLSETATPHTLTLPAHYNSYNDNKADGGGMFVSPHGVHGASPFDMQQQPPYMSTPPAYAAGSPSSHLAAMTRAVRVPLAPDAAAYLVERVREHVYAALDACATRIDVAAMPATTDARHDAAATVMVQPAWACAMCTAPSCARVPRASLDVAKLLELLAREHDGLVRLLLCSAPALAAVRAACVCALLTAPPPDACADWQLQRRRRSPALALTRPAPSLVTSPPLSTHEQGEGGSGDDVDEVHLPALLPYLLTVRHGKELVAVLLACDADVAAVTRVSTTGDGNAAHEASARNDKDDAAATATSNNNNSDDGTHATVTSAATTIRASAAATALLARYALPLLEDVDVVRRLCVPALRADASGDNALVRTVLRHWPALAQWLHAFVHAHAHSSSGSGSGNSSSANDVDGAVRQCVSQLGNVLDELLAGMSPAQRHACASFSTATDAVACFARELRRDEQQQQQQQQQQQPPTDRITYEALWSESGVMWRTLLRLYVSANIVDGAQLAQALFTLGGDKHGADAARRGRVCALSSAHLYFVLTTTRRCHVSATPSVQAAALCGCFLRYIEEQPQQSSSCVVGEKEALQLLDSLLRRTQLGEAAYAALRRCYVDSDDNRGHRRRHMTAVREQLMSTSRTRAPRHTAHEHTTTHYPRNSNSSHAPRGSHNDARGDKATTSSSSLPWLSSWSEVLRRYPQTGEPFPALPPGWRSSMSRSYGHYYFKPPHAQEQQQQQQTSSRRRVSGDDDGGGGGAAHTRRGDGKHSRSHGSSSSSRGVRGNGDTTTQSAAATATYRHPVTGAEYMASPQAFVQAYGTSTTLSELRTLAQRRAAAASEQTNKSGDVDNVATALDEESVQRWLSDQRLRNVYLDVAVLELLHITYRSGSKAKDSNSNRHGGGGGDDDAHKDKAATTTTTTTRKRSRSPTSATRRALAQKLRCTRDYAAAGAPFPPLPLRSGVVVRTDTTTGLYMFTRLTGSAAAAAAGAPTDAAADASSANTATHTATDTTATTATTTTAVTHHKEADGASVVRAVHVHPQTGQCYRVTPQALAQEHGVSVHRLAEAAQCSVTAVSRWLRDQRQRHGALDEAVVRELAVSYVDVDDAILYGAAAGRGRSSSSSSADKDKNDDRHRGDGEEHEDDDDSSSSSSRKRSSSDSDGSSDDDVSDDSARGRHRRSGAAKAAATSSSSLLSQQQQQQQASSSQRRPRRPRGGRRHRRH